MKNIVSEWKQNLFRSVLRLVIELWHYSIDFWTAIINMTKIEVLRKVNFVMYVPLWLLVSSQE